MEQSARSDLRLICGDRQPQVGDAKNSLWDGGEWGHYHDRLSQCHDTWGISSEIEQQPQPSMLKYMPDCKPSTSGSTKKLCALLQRGGEPCNAK